jgi:hypothetical protein
MESASSEAILASPVGAAPMSITAQLVAGGIAGVVADCFTHPLDTVRARLQTAVASSTRSAIVDLARSEGLRGFYRGFSAAAIGTAPANALYFGGYEITKRVVFAGREDNMAVHAVAGLVAELGGALIWVPADVLKQKVQVERSGGPSKYGTSLQAMKVILAEEGVRGLFRGFWMSVVTYGPFASSYFVVYEQMKKFVGKAWPDRKSDELPLPAYMLSGFVAGALGAALTNPLDAIKTRMQVEGGSRYSSALDVARSMVRTEGFSSFQRGLTARVLWIAPGTSITIAVFEFLRGFL